MTRETDLWQRVEALAGKLQELNPDWRRGQAFFNALAGIDSDRAGDIADTEADPYYDDSRILLFELTVRKVTLKDIDTLLAKAWKEGWDARSGWQKQLNDETIGWDDLVFPRCPYDSE